MPIDECLPPPSSENLPATDGKKYRDPQPDFMQRVRNQEILNRRLYQILGVRCEDRKSLEGPKKRIPSKSIESIYK